MRTGAGLALICVGAILAFAVTTNTSDFNLHTAGWVLMLIGLIGILLPSRTYGWLGRRLLVRRSYPSGKVEHIPVPPYVARNPGTAPLEAGLSSRPSLLDQDQDLIEQSEMPYNRTAGGQPGGRSGGGVTEVIEDLYENP
ncbi:MAG TPA: DUF6458 family protein [Trebonia sp.]|nr:DUF6458 family protein [Trebonia sp.]